MNTVTEQLILPLRGNRLQRLVALYSLLWHRRYGRRPTVNYGRVGSALQPLWDNYSEYQLSLMMIQFFDWSDIKLTEKCYPITWFPNTADAIAVYLQNVLKVNLDSDQAIKPIIDKELKSMGIVINT